MINQACCFDDEAPTTFDTSRFAGRRLLIAGLGGGADCVTAWALARWLAGSATPPASVILANAKRPDSLGNLKPRTPGGGVYDAAPDSDDFFLDTRLPDGHPCLILRSQPVIPGLDALDFNHVLALDTGADVVTRHGRDWQTLQALRASGKPVTLALVSPGSDGQESQATLRQCVGQLDAVLLGHQPAAVLRPFILEVKDLLVEYARARKRPGEQSTLMIALEALDKPPDEIVEVHRDERPDIPARWLQGIWFFDCR